VIPLTSRGQPPSLFELLQEAVLTLKEAGTGASLLEIRRQLQQRYKVAAVLLRVASARRENAVVRVVSDQAAVSTPTKASSMVLRAIVLVAAVAQAVARAAKALANTLTATPLPDGSTNAERELRQAAEFHGESEFEHWETAVVKLEVSEVDSAGSSIADKAEDLPAVGIEAPEAPIEEAKGAESTPEVVSVEGTAVVAPIVQVIVHALAVYARSEKDAGVGPKTWKSLRKVTLELSGFISLCHHKDAPVVNGLFKAASVNIGLDIWLVESWDLSEAVKKTTGDENKDVKLKISEAGAPPGGDAEDAPVVSIGSIEDSAAREPVSGSPQEKAKDSEHAGGVTEAPSEVVDVSPETPAEGSVENDVPVEATKSAEPDEGSRSLEAVPFDDVEAESGMS
jgi:hypothetical protein